MKNKLWLAIALLFTILCLVSCEYISDIANVTFDLNGAGNTWTVGIKSGEKISEPAEPSRDGYVFEGWYLGEEKFHFSKPITKNIKLVAKWAPKSPIVTFDSNGGTEVSSIQLDYGTKLTLPSNPTKEGYYFLGWTLDEDIFNTETLITNNITLRALWGADTEIIDEYVAYNVTTNIAYKSLDSAVYYAESGNTIRLLQDITREDLGDGNNGALTLTKNIILDGAGHKLVLNTATRGIWIDADNVDAVIKNLTIDGRTSENGERAIQVNPGIKNTKLTIENCDLSATYYTINIPNNAEVELVIKDSTITGWGAINLWSATYNVLVDNSTLIGINDKDYDAEGWNGFGTVVLEGDTTNATEMGAEGLIVTINNSIIDTQSTTGNIQKAILFNAQSKNNIVNISDTVFKYKAVGDNSEAILYVDNGIENELIIDDELKNIPVHTDAMYGWDSENIYEVAFKFIIQDIGFDMCNGEWITLTNNVNLSDDIERTPFYNDSTDQYDSAGTISITFGDYNVTGPGKVILSSKVTILADKQVNCFYTENGTLIEGEEQSDGKWKYTWTE